MSCRMNELCLSCAAFYLRKKGSRKREQLEFPKGLRPTTKGEGRKGRPFKTADVLALNQFAVDKHTMESKSIHFGYAL